MPTFQKEPHPSNEALNLARKEISDYAMALDLLTQIAHSDSEKEAIENILGLFAMLFSPQKLCYVALEKGESGQTFSLSPLSDDEAAISARARRFTESYAWTDSGKGFWVRLKFKTTHLGIMIVDEISFPDYKERYLNLALSMVDLCALAIENARKHEQLKKSEQKLKKEKEKLEAALAEVKKLSGLLPICSHCKKIRDDQGYWNQLETYIQSHSEAQFSHSICQECLERLYPDSDEESKS